MSSQVKQADTGHFSHQAKMKMAAMYISWQGTSIQRAARAFPVPDIPLNYTFATEATRTASEIT